MNGAPEHRSSSEARSLLDMLADPAIQSEMVRDGATRADLEGLASAGLEESVGRQTVKRQLDRLRSLASGG